MTIVNIPYSPCSDEEFGLIKGAFVKDDYIMRETWKSEALDTLGGPSNYKGNFLISLGNRFNLALTLLVIFSKDFPLALENKFNDLKARIAAISANKGESIQRKVNILYYDLFKKELLNSWKTSSYTTYKETPSGINFLYKN